MPRFEITLLGLVTTLRVIDDFRTELPPIQSSVSFELLGRPTEADTRGVTQMAG
jgi:hypothetical protein